MCIYDMKAVNFKSVDEKTLKIKQRKDQLKQFSTMNVSDGFFVLFIISISMIFSVVSSMKLLSRQRRQFNNFDDYEYNNYDYNMDPDTSQFFNGQNQGSDFAFPNTDNSLNRQQRQPQTNELIFSNNRRQIPSNPANNNNNNNPTSAPVVVINNRPTIATVPPFRRPTTPTPQFLSCYNSCQTTPEYNPICGSNMQMYFNEQKFNCALRCGADVQIVRRGSCQGLFPMMRG